MTNCQVALNVAEGAEVDLRHCALSFNEVALVGGGRGSIAACQFWGNLHRSTIHLSEGALAATQARPQGLARALPQGLTLAWPSCHACPPWRDARGFVSQSVHPVSGVYGAGSGRCGAAVLSQKR